MLAASARAEAVQSLADDPPAMALPVIAHSARRVTTARLAAIVLTDPAARQPSLVAALDHPPDLPPSAVSAESLLRIGTPGVRMVEIMGRSATIGVLVLAEITEWGMLASDIADTVLDLADLAAIAVTLDRAYRSGGATAARIDGDVVEESEPLADLWWVALNIENRQLHASTTRDRHQLGRLRDRVDELIHDVQRIQWDKRHPAPPATAGDRHEP